MFVCLHDWLYHCQHIIVLLMEKVFICTSMTFNIICFRLIYSLCFGLIPRRRPRPGGPRRSPGPFYIIIYNHLEYMNVGIICNIFGIIWIICNIFGIIRDCRDIYNYLELFGIYS